MRRDGVGMKIFSFHSPAVRPLWDIFEDSVRRKTSLELNPVEVPNQYDGSKYGEDRYWRMMKWIGECRLQKIIEHSGQIIVMSGCDGIFFSDPVEDLNRLIVDRDLVAANDSAWSQYLCPCLQVVKCNDSVVNFYKSVYADKMAGLGSEELLVNNYRDMLRWAVLPREKYWNCANGAVWTPEMVVPQPPSEMVWFHANYTIGTEHKLLLTQRVMEKVAIK